VGGDYGMSVKNEVLIPRMRELTRPVVQIPGGKKCNWLVPIRARKKGRGGKIRVKGLNPFVLRGNRAR
jgi:hypothetical protein